MGLEQQRFIFTSLQYARLREARRRPRVYDWRHNGGINAGEILTYGAILQATSAVLSHFSTLIHIRHTSQELSVLVRVLHLSACLFASLHVIILKENYTNNPTISFQHFVL